MELQYNRNEYIQTLEYKMFVILCAMMRMADRTSSEFAEEIRRHRAMGPGTVDGYTFDRHFVEYADAGYVRVDMLEVYITISYVAKAFGYNPLKLKRAVKKVAEGTEFADGTYKDAKGLLKALSQVYQMM